MSRSSLITAAVACAVAMTVLAVAALSGAGQQPPSTAGVATPMPAGTDDDSAGLPFDDVPEQLPPAGAPPTGDEAALSGRVPDSGPGTYRVAKLKRPATSDRGRLIRYSVRVERGLPIDPRDAALVISTVLGDRRSWTGSGRWRFSLVDSPRNATLQIYLTSPRTTDRLCAPLLTHGRVSCQSGNRVILNARRWTEGAGAYGSDVATYQIYLVNHEVGHAVGFNHRGCPAPGRLAPVMMQQTKSIGRCRANPWPYPGRAGATKR